MQRFPVEYLPWGSPRYPTPERGEGGCYPKGGGWLINWVAVTPEGQGWLLPQRGKGGCYPRGARVADQLGGRYPRGVRVAINHVGWLLPQSSEGGCYSADQLGGCYPRGARVAVNHVGWLLPQRGEGGCYPRGARVAVQLTIDRWRQSDGRRVRGTRLETLLLKPKIVRIPLAAAVSKQLACIGGGAVQPARQRAIARAGVHRQSTRSLPRWTHRENTRHSSCAGPAQRSGPGPQGPRRNRARTAWHALHSNRFVGP